MKKKENAPAGQNGRLLAWICLTVMVFGISLLIYPTAANWISSLRMSTAVVSYGEMVSGLSEEEKHSLFSAAHAYNEKLKVTPARLSPTSEMHAVYSQTLDIDGLGLIGIIDIPKISVSLPVYHGTSEAVLQKGAGHVEGSSFPVGSEGGHALISAHRGLPSAELFTNLDRLQTGDEFTVKVLETVLTYRVCEIRTVLPEDVSALDLVPGRDLVTLITCTPYGINTHRLLVTAERVPENEECPANTLSDTAVSGWTETLLVFAALQTVLMVLHRRRRQR